MKKIVCEIEKCLGCRACQMACAVEHSTSKNLAQAVDESPLPGYRVMVEYVEGTPVPLQCQHCEDAPCVRVCPTHCLEKDPVSGIVRAHREKCIGCTWCVLVCPFGAARMRALDKVVLKCDLCEARQAQGKGPACVEACPTKALQFRVVEDVARGKRQEVIREFLLAREKAEAPGTTGSR